MVGEAGIEPTTPGLEGRCSIRLSYSPTVFILAAKRLIQQARRSQKCTRFDSLKESHHGCLGPVNAFGGAAREKGAVAAVARLDEGDVGIGEDTGAGLREKADEWV